MSRQNLSGKPVLETLQGVQNASKEKEGVRKPKKTQSKK